MIITRMFRSLLTLALAVVVACGGEKPAATATSETTTTAATHQPPSADEARELVASSAEFSEYQFTNAAYTLPMQRSAMNEPARAAARQLSDAKWIAFDGDGNLLLAAKAKDDKRFLVRPNGSLDIVPLAKKELTAVTNVTANASNEPVVEFEWKWIPNEVGSAFQSGPLFDRYSRPQKARATLLRSGSEWTVLKIEEVN